MSSPPRHVRPVRAAALDLDALLRVALEMREPILKDPATNALRIFNGRSDGVDGLVIDKLAQVLIVQCHVGRLQCDEADLRRMLENAAEALAATSVYRKIFPRDRNRDSAAVLAQNRDPRPWLGAPADEEFEVLEHAVKFRVRPYDGYSVGLFLEQRGNRDRIRRLAAGKRLLNTFAYTCGFSVAAAVGGAASTVSADLSKRFLEWGKRSFAANGVPLDAHRFYAADTFDAYRRLGKRGERFDMIVIDPPTFARDSAGRPFVLTEQLEALLSGAFALAADGCLLLISTNHRGTDRRRLEDAVHAAAGSRACEIVERPRLALDFRGDPGFATSLLLRIG